MSDSTKTDIPKKISGGKQHNFIHRTDQEDYFPATSKQADEIKESIEEMKRQMGVLIPESKPELLSPMKKQAQSEISQDELRAKFDRLVAQWNENTKFSSTVLEMSMDPAYQQIIGMGHPAVQFILQSLRVKADHWFWALKAITEEDPVPQKSRGNIKEMTEAWLRWGREKGYE